MRSRPGPRLKWLAAALVLAIVALAGSARVRVEQCLGSSAAFPRAAEAAIDAFMAGEQPGQAQYARLFGYFVEGFVTYRTPLGAYARYPGLPQGEGLEHDRHQDRLEGFSRIAPLLAAWIAGGRPVAITLPSGRQADVLALLRGGLLAGTDPASPEYWGAIGDRDSRIVESADIALAVWLARDSLWRGLDDSERARVAAWLGGASGKRTVDNNWHLFIVLVNAVLRDLGAPADLDEQRRRYERMKTFYRGDGWFSDGAGDRFDYYNAWGIHYALLWLRKIDASWDSAFLGDVHRRYLEGSKRFFGPHGFPIMGRSACYRLGAPAPLVIGHALHPDAVSAGEARRALDLSWRFFIAHGAAREGRITQGYCGDDPRVLDSYSGPASCLWSLRSLVAAFAYPDDAPFWRTRGDALPVERESFEYALPAIGWTLAGDRSSGDVVLRIGGRNAAADPAALAPYSRRDQALDALVCRARRPDNSTAKYERPSYGSREPFMGCTP